MAVTIAPYNLLTSRNKISNTKLWLLYELSNVDKKGKRLQSPWVTDEESMFQMGPSVADQSAITR